MLISLIEGHEDYSKISFAFSNQIKRTKKDDPPLTPEEYEKNAKIIAARIQANKFTFHRESEKDRHYPEEAAQPKVFNDLSRDIYETYKPYKKLYKKKFGSLYMLTQEEKDERKEKYKGRLSGWTKIYKMRDDFAKVVGSDIFTRILFIKYVSFADLKPLYKLFEKYKTNKDHAIKLSSENSDKLIKGVNLFEFTGASRTHQGIQKLFKFFVVVDVESTEENIAAINKISEEYSIKLEQNKSKKDTSKRIKDLESSLSLIRSKYDYDKEEENEYLEEIKQLKQ